MEHRLTSPDRDRLAIEQGVGRDPTSPVSSPAVRSGVAIPGGGPRPDSTQSGRQLQRGTDEPVELAAVLDDPLTGNAWRVTPTRPPRNLVAEWREMHVPKPIPSCPRCGRRHRLWRAAATCLLHPVYWCIGRGPFASVSDCPRGRTVILFTDRNEALKAKATIDRGSCGGACIRLHRIVNLQERLAAGVRK